MPRPVRGTLPNERRRRGGALCLAAACAALAGAAPALAHHRQTPPVVALTTSGDTPLPRLVPPGRVSLVLATPAGAGRRIVTLQPWRNLDDPSHSEVVAEAGAHANPVISASGRVVGFDSASDPLGLGLPGRQVVGSYGGGLFPVSSEPTGTSENPALDGAGFRIAFESTADLAGGGTPGVRHVFVRDPDGSVRQLSRGVGPARNPVLSPRRDMALFESSSHPVTGANTGVPQIWFGDVDGRALEPITAGLGPSTNPALSNDGRLVLFESTADLAGSQANTGIPQIFAWDTRTRTYARVTNDAAGCRLPSAHRVQRDWRIAYVCGGVPYFTMLRADERYQVTAAGGATQRVVAALGVHFVLMSTRADLLSGAGATPGNQVYLVNLYKRPPVLVAAPPVTWFPHQGLSPL